MGIDNGIIPEISSINVNDYMNSTNTILLKYLKQQTSDKEYESKLQMLKEIIYHNLSNGNKTITNKIKKQFEIWVEEKEKECSDPVNEEEASEKINIAERTLGTESAPIRIIGKNQPSPDGKAERGIPDAILATVDDEPQMIKESAVIRGGKRGKTDPKSEPDIVEDNTVQDGSSITSKEEEIQEGEPVDEEQFGKERSIPQTAPKQAVEDMRKIDNKSDSIQDAEILGKDVSGQEDEAESIIKPRIAATQPKKETQVIQAAIPVETRTEPLPENALPGKEPDDYRPSQKQALEPSRELAESPEYQPIKTEVPQDLEKESDKKAIPLGKPEPPGSIAGKLRFYWNKGPRQQAAIAIVIVLLILLPIFIYMILPKNNFSVTMPVERIGDRGTYGVEGRMWMSSKDGFSTGGGALRDLEINMDGETTYQINDTIEKTDGLGVERDTIDKYLSQNLQLSGSIELLGSSSTINDAGSINTKYSSYTCLITNETIRNSVYNEVDIHILSLYSFNSVDQAIYYPTGEGFSFNLFDLREREFTEGDKGDLANGQLKWEAVGKEKVYKWDCLKLHITENGSGADWRELSGDVWVSNDCSLPVKVHIHMKIDTTKFTKTEQLVLKMFTGNNGIVEVDYEATMRGFNLGENKIPWDIYGKDPSLNIRENVQFDKFDEDNGDFIYAPLIRGENYTGSFDPDFSPEAAARWAVNNSNNLRDFVEEHEDDVYIVDGTYRIENGTQSWDLLFGYRKDGLNVDGTAYNITINKRDNIITKTDNGEITINNPSNSRGDIEQAINIADCEDIYLDMDLINDILFTGGNEDSRADESEIDFDGGVTFSVENDYLQTGLALSGFNPLIQDTVPAGYGYNLVKQVTDGDHVRYIIGRIDAQKGRVVFELIHDQTGQV